MRNRYIGLMSGTSIDAIDAVLVDFTAEPWQIVSTHSHEIPQQTRQKILNLCQTGESEIDNCGQLDRELGALFANAVSALLSKSACSKRDVIAIGSHGQTIRHRPNHPSPFTLQIGDPTTIACLTGIDTIADFRKRDIAEGGQGAPLVPAFHRALLDINNISSPTAVVNIGGMANITTYQANTVKGFDTGPGNVLMDAWSLKNTGQPFDISGHWAASGEIDTPLLNHLLDHPFLQLPPPKSTGREDFNLSWLNNTLTRVAHINTEDVQRTLLEFTATSIAQTISAEASIGKVYICGGGAKNSFLLTRLRALLPNTQIDTTQALNIDPNWVEAVAFAWLAMQFNARTPGNVPAVTGAKRAVTLGALFPA